MGIIIALFYYNIYDLFLEKGIKSIILRQLQSFGIIAGFFFSGVGVFPTDIAFNYHVFFANNAFYLLLIVSILHTYTIYKTKILSNQYALGYLIFCIFLIMYVGLLMYGGNPSEGMSKGMFQVKHVMSQKLITLIIMCATLHQTIGIEKHIKKNE